MLQNPATHFTVNKFYHQLKSQGIKVAKTTLHEYLDHLRDVFLIHIEVLPVWKWLLAYKA
jgi:hypothetical protein